MKLARLVALGAPSLILAAALFAGLAAAQPVMKAGTATINDVQHEYLKRFAERIAKQAPQKLKVEVYPAEQLGNNARMLEGLTLGTVEAVIGPPEFIVGVDPRFQIVGAPGLVKDMQHAVRLTAGREVPRRAVRLRRVERHPAASAWSCTAATRGQRASP